MSLLVPLPPALRARLDQNPTTHPGLMLDKYVRSWDPDETGKLAERVQKPAIQAVVRLSQQAPAGFDFAALRDRWLATLDALGAERFAATTIGALTMHLARASALENAGLCLHPIYGFACLPGSGLKGMAHAYACELWLPAQPHRQEAWETICRVFGFSPSPWLGDLARRLGFRAPAGSCAASVVFHDAWPRTWPRLAADIVNNHHPAYYQSPEDARDHPPGDWENPVPINFLVVVPGTEFVFALSPRRDQLESVLPLARTWLQGALCHSGAGAKTAAGYGGFQLLAPASSPASPRRVWRGLLTGEEALPCEATVRLRFVTPGFLGGPDRHAQPAARLSSLRGVLRSWWRAWHGHLSLRQLRDQEASTFGSLARGTGLTVMPLQPDKLKILPKGQNMGPGGSPLGYLGYGPIGYANAAHANLTQLDAIEPGQSFAVRLVHRSSTALHEALKSLWLLAALGGMGSRSRRAWGAITLSNACPDIGLPDLTACGTIAAYRAALTDGLEQLAPSARRRSASELSWTAISRECRVVLSTRTFASWREALEDLGSRFQQFRSYDTRGHSRPGHRGDPGPDYHATKNLLTNTGSPPESVPERAAFGMPYAQTYRSLGRARASFVPVWEDGSRTVDGRRASPLFCKIVPLSNGTFLWQVAWLPAQFLPHGAAIQGTRTDGGRPRKLANSPYPAPTAFGVPRSPADPTDTLVRQFLDWLEGAMPERGGENERPVTSRRTPATGTTRQAIPTAPSQPGRAAGKSTGAPPVKPVNQGQTRMGAICRRPQGWVAMFEGDAREAVITNPAKLPTDLQDGARANFFIESASKNAGIRARFEGLR